MLIKSKHKVGFDKYFTRRFLILPFVCAKCGNKFMFESGVTADDDYGDWSRNRIYEYPKQYSYCPPPSKFCDICGKEIEGMYEANPNTDPSEVADWMNGLKK